MAQSTVQKASADKINTILTLIRRGESISQISSMMNVKRNEVQQIMDWYVQHTMG